MAEAGLPPTLSFIPVASSDVLSFTSNSKDIILLLTLTELKKFFHPPMAQTKGKVLQHALDQRLWKAESVEFTLKWNITNSQAISISPEKPLHALLRRLWDCKGEALGMELLLQAYIDSPQQGNSVPQEYLCETATAFRIGKERIEGKAV